MSLTMQCMWNLHIRLRTLFLLEVGVAQQFVRCTVPQSVWVVQLVVAPTWCRAMPLPDTPFSFGKRSGVREGCEARATGCVTGQGVQVL
jgi:hypothetical protein